MRQNLEKKLRYLKQDTWEYVPPNNEIILINPETFAVEKSMGFVYIDHFTIEGVKSNTFEVERQDIYSTYMLNHREYLKDRNAYVACWLGDSKIYLAICYAYETMPFYIEVNPNFSLHELKKESA